MLPVRKVAGRVGGCNEVVAAASTMSIVHVLALYIPLVFLFFFFVVRCKCALQVLLVSTFTYRIIQIEKRTRRVKTPTAVNISLQVKRAAV